MILIVVIIFTYSEARPAVPESGAVEQSDEAKAAFPDGVAEAKAAVTEHASVSSEVSALAFR